jgi:hypothetical protein
VIVEAGSSAMHGPDERARAAADHAEAQPTAQARDGGVHDLLPARISPAAFDGCERR